MPKYLACLSLVIETPYPLDTEGPPWPAEQSAVVVKAFQRGLAEIVQDGEEAIVVDGLIAEDE